MRKVTLAPGVVSSAIGFGCAPILGSVDADRARTALKCALDCGVNHFDVAPSYGYGEAEGFLGRELGSRRKDCVVVTKFGIDVNPAAKVLKPLKNIVRAVLKRGQGGGGQSGAKSIAGNLMRRVEMTAPNMQASVERSLRRLRSDYIDVLMLHEPSGSLANLEELIATADRLKQDGKLRAFGLSTMLANIDEHRAYLDRFDVLMFDAPPAGEHQELRGRPCVLFSAFRHAGTQDRAQVLRRLWAEFPQGVVVASMFSPEHIRANAATAQDAG